MVSSGWQPKGKRNIMPYEKIEIQEIAVLQFLSNQVFIREGIRGMFFLLVIFLFLHKN